MIIPNELLFPFHVSCVVGVAFIASLWGRGALRALIVLSTVWANFFVVKPIAIFSLAACGGGMYMVGVGVGLLILERFAGREYATETVRLTVAASLIFLVLTFFHLMYEPAPVDTAHASFELLFGRVPRITVVSLLAHSFAQYSTLFLYRASALLMSHQRAHTVSLLLGQILDSLFFFTGTFLGIVPFAHIAQMIGISCVVKSCMVTVSTLMLVIAEHKGLFSALAHPEPAVQEGGVRSVE